MDTEEQVRAFIAKCVKLAADALEDEAERLYAAAQELREVRS
jgi:hypothetical protein